MVAAIAGLKIDKRKLEELQRAVDKASRKLPQELAKAINRTAKVTKSSPKRVAGIIQKIREEIIIKAKDLNPLIKINPRAKAGSLHANITLKETDRIPLSRFNPNQVQAGTTYRIKKGGKREMVIGAFMGPVPGARKVSWENNVFIRVGGKVKMTKGRHAGKMRQRITKLHGPSPWGVFVKNRLKPQQVKDTEAELSKQIDEAIRENTLRASGIIPPRKKK